MSDTPDLVVDTENKYVKLVKKHKGPIAIGALVVIAIVIISVFSKSEGYASPDGVVAKRPGQKRSDVSVDKDWNLAELEKSVALLNRKTGSYSN